MALHKENYGLIYNDDGSLCATLRKDDVPFEGVTSFAVESGTTNLFTNPIFQNGESGFDYVTGWSSRTIKDGGPLGKYIELVDDSTSVDGRYGNTFNITAEQTYTFSVYVNVLEWNQDGHVELYFHFLDSSNTILLATRSGLLGEDAPHSFVGQGWRRYKITGTAPANAAKVRAFVYSGVATTSRIQVTGFQFEQKPFVTSLVVGSRPTGRLYIPLDKLGFNPAADEWVIAYWKKPVGTNNGLTGYNITAIGCYSADKSVGYIWWGKLFNSNTFRVNVTYNNQTAAAAGSSTFDPNWYFNNWHFEVFIKTSSEIKYYVDGVLQCSLTLSYPLQTFTEGLYIGGYKDNPCNNLITNILLAKYNPSIWTDAYIQELYNMRRPFSVPPRMPII